MPPRLATLLCAVGVLGLFWLDRDSEDRPSPAVWLPVIWLAILGSRSVSEWLTGSSTTGSAEQYTEGSPLDAAIWGVLTLLGLMVLAVRGRATGDLLRKNPPLVAFLLYCAVSALWSDFPFVAFKRWTKALGSLTMVLVLLTDANVVSAIKRFVMTTALALIPTSILLIKYYPDLGRYYDRWEGTAYYCGVATDKNILGSSCLVVGLGILWRFVDTFRETSHRTRKLIAVGTVLGMVFWLFLLADSATSFMCFTLGSSLIVIVSLSKRVRPAMVHFLVAGTAIVGAAAYFLQDAFALMVGSLGRNTTLTGRTDLWLDLIQLDTHPWFGAGFESFFLGERLDFLWSKYWWHPNEAHNGYLETYLTLGIVGLCLLALLIITGYRNVLNVYRRDPRSGSLRLAFLVIAPIYNITEAAFKAMHPVWLLFLLAVAAMPDVQTQEYGQKDLELASAAGGPKAGRFGAHRPAEAWPDTRSAAGYRRDSRPLEPAPSGGRPKSIADRSTEGSPMTARRRSYERR